MARGDAGPSSDIDLLAEIDHASAFSLFDHAELQDQLSELLDRSVEIATAQWKMRPRMRQRVEAEAILVF